VTDIHHTALDDGKGTKPKQPKQAEALPKECPKCAYLRPPKVMQCPSCGFKPEIVSTIQCEDGNLIEFRGKRKADRFDKETFYGQLRVYARQKGYNEGWMKHKFRAAFGVWPNSYRNAPDLTPTPEVLSWIKSEQIRFAKARAS
jgi:hypothetical protein